MLLLISIILLVTMISWISTMFISVREKYKWKRLVQTINNMNWTEKSDVGGPNESNKKCLHIVLLILYYLQVFMAN